MKRILGRALTVALVLIAMTAQADHRAYQEADVTDLDFVNGPTNYGAAWLIRSEDEIEGKIMSRVDWAGYPYTLWLVIFNNPEECNNGAGGRCGPPDLGDPDVNPCMSYLSGAISAPDGQLKRNGKPAGGGVVNMDFEVEEGHLPDDLFVLGLDLPGLSHTCAVTMEGSSDGEYNNLGLAEGQGFAAQVDLIIDLHPSVGEGESWVSDLTSTNQPGGPAMNHRLAYFPPCPGGDCSP